MQNGSKYEVGKAQQPLPSFISLQSSLQNKPGTSSFPGQPPPYDPVDPVRVKRTKRDKGTLACDPMLIHRIEQYIDTNNYKRNISIDSIIKGLQFRHPEYRRKKQAVFQKSVEKAFIAYSKKVEAELLQVAKDVQESAVEERQEAMDTNSAEDVLEVNNHMRGLYNRKPNNEPVIVVDETEEAGPSVNQNGIAGSESAAAQKDDRSKKVRKKPDSDASTPRRPKHVVATVETSNVTFEDVAVSEEMLLTISELVYHLKHPELTQKMGAATTTGLLLHGPPGCGKTLLANAIAGEFALPIFRVAGPQLVSGVSGESEEKIRALFEQAKDNTPCVLFLDEIDVISHKRETAQREMERRISTQLISCMDASTTDSVLVVGTTSRPESLDPGLRMAGRFDKEIVVGIPDENNREKILRVMTRAVPVDQGVSMKGLARLTPGYVGADLRALVTEAVKKSMQRVILPGNVDSAASRLQEFKERIMSETFLAADQLEGARVLMSDFESALSVVQPSAKREGFATVPEVTWEDVGALKDVRKKLKLAIVHPVHHPEKFAALGLSHPTGVLLCGPPGCGKTLLAKAVANEAGINFISVKGPELFNMYVGESERAVRQCFQRARNSAPCVIFFDELDALCPRRNDSDSNSGTRVVNQLLTEMDGMGVRTGVYLMAATNRPDIIDPAILRPGRMDQVIYLGLPTAEDRTDILKAVTKNGTRPIIGADVDLEALGYSVYCEGFTGADLANLVKVAASMVVEESLDKEDVEMVVHRRHFQAALRLVKPSVSEKELKRYEQYRAICTEREPILTSSTSVEADEKTTSDNKKEEEMVQVVDSGESDIEIL